MLFGAAGLADGDQKVQTHFQLGRSDIGFESKGMQVTDADFQNLLEARIGGVGVGLQDRSQQCLRIGRWQNAFGHEQLLARLKVKLQSELRQSIAFNLRQCFWLVQIFIRTK